MKDYQIKLLQTAVDVGALKFGSFILKSGRKSPYFFNAGAFCDGDALTAFAESYAALIVDKINAGEEIDVLFGPAYKGIPFVAAISVCLSIKYQINLPWAFNRKEAKAHGEGGMLVGAGVQGKRTLIIDDVLTAGTAVKQSINLLQAEGALPIGLIVALDRQEKITDDKTSALMQISKEFDIFTQSVVCLNDLVGFIKYNPDFSDHFAVMAAYREEYGV